MLYRPLLALSMASMVMAAEPAAAIPAGDMPLQQKVSYLFGQQLARTIKQLDLDEAVLLQSLTDAKAGKPSKVPETEAQSAVQAWVKELQARATQQGEARKTSNVAWLAGNAKKTGVKTTASGLQYKVITSGKGKQPSASDVVTVNYKGTLIDGTVFDASQAHGGPASFGVDSVIKGWTEALQLMHEGDKWEVYIPAELAYGTQAPPSIGPNQILVFEVELLKVGAPLP